MAVAVKKKKRRKVKKKVKSLPQRQVVVDEIELTRSICLDSFFSFVVEFWDTVVPDPYQHNWHVPYICHELQKETERIIKRFKKRYDYVIINIPPGTSKSTILMVMLNAWLWAKSPTMSFIGCSYEATLAIDKARLTRAIVKSEKYQQYFPDVKISQDMDAKGKFANTQKGERQSAGSKGNVTGRHADVIVVDDPINPKGARSDADKKAAIEFITETLPTRKKQKKITPTFIIMQRLAQNDPTGFLLDLAQSNPKLRIKHICLPGEVTDDIKPSHLLRFYKDGLLDPNRLDKDVLNELKIQLLAYGYAGQILQSPIPAGVAMFNINNVHLEEVPPDISSKGNWKKIVRYWDKAGTEDGGCFSVGVLMGEDWRDRIWILHVVRIQLSIARRNSLMKDVADQDGYQVEVGVEEEPGAAGKESALTTQKALRGHTVIRDKVTGSKVVRAEPFATVVEAQNLYLAPEGYFTYKLAKYNVPSKWHAPYLNEMEYFPNSTFMDQIDSSSGAYHQLVPEKQTQIGFNIGA